MLGQKSTSGSETSDFSQVTASLKVTGEEACRRLWHAIFN